MHNTAGDRFEDRREQLGARGRLEGGLLGGRLGINPQGGFLNHFRVMPHRARVMRRAITLCWTLRYQL
jgi:hypothetical protein